MPLILLGYMKAIEKYFRQGKKKGIYFTIDLSIEKQPGQSHTAMSRLLFPNQLEKMNSSADILATEGIKTLPCLYGWWGCL